LTYKRDLDLDNVKLNQRAKYLGQRSSSSYFIVLSPDTQTRWAE